MTRRARITALSLLFVPVTGHASSTVVVADETSCVDPEAVVLAVEEAIRDAASCRSHDEAAIEEAMRGTEVDVGVIASGPDSRTLAIRVRQGGKVVWSRDHQITPGDCPAAGRLTAHSVWAGLSELYCPASPAPASGPAPWEFEAGIEVLASPEGFPVGGTLGLATIWRSGGPWVASVGAATQVEGGLGLAADATAWRAGFEVDAGVGFDVPLGGPTLRPTVGLALGPAFAWGAMLSESRPQLLPRLDVEGGAALRLAGGLHLGVGVRVPLLRYAYAISGGADVEPVLEPSTRFLVGTGYAWEVPTRSRD